MSNKITGKVLAVQLGREESHLVLLSNAGEVQHAVTLPTPLGAVDDGAIRNLEEIRGMLKEALKDPGFEKVRKVVFTLCTSQVIAETVRTPDLPEAKLGKLLHANADMYFPVDIKDYRLIWQVTGSSQNDDGQKELMVQLWAVPAAMLNAYYKVANGCGLSVVAIDYCGHSMASVAGASFAKVQKVTKERKKLDLNMELSFGGKKKVEPVQEAVSQEEGPAETQLYLSLDKDLLGMTFVQNNQVVMQRIIRCGSQLVYQFGELAMMLEYFQSMEQGRGSEIRGFVTGSYAKDPDLVADLADMLGISLVAPAVSYDLSYSLCVGASRTELDFGNPALNVVDKARREVKSQLWQYGLVLGGGLVLMVVVLMTLAARLGWDSNVRKLQSQQQTLAIQASKVAGFADNYYDYANKYNAYSADWEAVFGSMQTYNDNLVLVMDELEDMLPEDSSVLGMQIAANGLNVTFACENKEEAAYLIMALRDMKYADLMVISDMGGGGAGPATSFGSGSEAAPREGSADTINGVPMDQWEILRASISTDLDPYVVGYNLGLGFRTKALLADLKEAYGLKVENTYETLAELQEDMGALITYEKRANAFWRMCTTNPFAMDAADDLLMLDYTTGGSLYQYVLNGLEEEGYGPNEVYKHKSVEELQEHIELLAGIIVNYDGSYDAMGQVEKLVVTDPELEAWYIYYLEAEMTKVEVVDAMVLELEEEKPLPYLDLDKLTLEILNEGAFVSENELLNDALFALMSQRTMAFVNAMAKPEIPEEEITTPTQPEEETTTPTQPEEETTTPTQPEEETTTPTQPEEETTTPTQPEQDETASLTQLLKIYLPGYLREDYLPPYGDATAQVERVLDHYFEKGVTGNKAEYDTFLNEYIDAKSVDAELTALVIEYKENPNSLKNQSIRKMLDNYVNGGTGNDVLDAWVERCGIKIEPPTTEPPATEPPTTEPPTTEPPTTEPSDPTTPSEPEDELDPTYAAALKTYLPDYLMKDELPDHAMAVMIEMALDNFFETGASGQDPKYDKFLNDYIASKAVDAELYELLAQYEKDPQSLKNQSIRMMLDYYFVDESKTTGNDVLDAWIKRCDEATEAPEKVPVELDPTLATLLKTYLPSYLVNDTLPSIGDTTSKAEAALDKFFEEGKSGEGDLYDNFLNDYIGSKEVDDELTSLVYMYHQNPDALKNKSVRKMLDNFFNLELKSTGNDALDAWITRAMEAQEEFVKGISEKLPEWLEKFLNNYDTGDAAGNAIIEKYLTTGKVDSEEHTEILDKSVTSNKAVHQRLLVWLNAYLYNKTAIAKYPVMVTVFDNYYKSEAKSTGSTALDAQIKQAAKDLANAANKPSGGSGSGSGQSQPQDTRVYFAVILNYNDELANAELIRKGLDYNKKIPMLEVGK